MEGSLDAPKRVPDTIDSSVVEGIAEDLVDEMTKAETLLGKHFRPDNDTFVDFNEDGTSTLMTGERLAAFLSLLAAYNEGQDAAHGLTGLLKRGRSFQSGAPDVLAISKGSREALEEVRNALAEARKFPAPE